MRHVGRSTFVHLFLAVLVAFGVGVGIVRLIYGLGATTNLSNQYPWGLWIVNVVFLVPFSSGAFMILAIIHILNKQEYQSLARPVVLIGFLGEIMVMTILLLDLGRWNQFYNVLLPRFWNIHSLLFQVGICLTIYLGIMLLEVVPILLERLGWQKPLYLIRMTTGMMAIVGVVLSTLHQFSLGAMFLLVPHKLHPLWWTPLLPLQFLTSAVFSGLAVAILVAVATLRVFRRPLNSTILSNLARVLFALLGFYLLLRIGDLVARDKLGLLFPGDRPSQRFWAEMGIGVLLPLVLLGSQKVRNSSWGLVLGSACTLVGLALNRTSTVLLVLQTQGAAYVPHWMEISISVTAVCAGILAFSLAIRFLPILPGDKAGWGTTLPDGWSHWVLVFGGSSLSLVAIAVVIVLQPMTKVEASQTIQMTPYSSTRPGSGTCEECHQSQQALVDAGANATKAASLVIVPLTPGMPHANVACVTCHYGQPGAADTVAIHADILVDATADNVEICLACHQDLSGALPQDRLRTPHNEITLGQTVDLACSDCHGGVGHGFDPAGKGITCTMSACLTCHQERQMDAALQDCVACHIKTHQVIPDVQCTACHQSAESWQDSGISPHSCASAAKNTGI